MYLKYKLIFSILTLLILFSITACSDDSTTGSGDETSSATINGAVEDEFAKSSSDAKAKAVENTVVTAARISSNGSLELLEETETDVNASGDFTLEVDATVAEEIVIVADNEGDRLTGYISSEIENESTYTVKPIDTEYSAETDVYTRIKSQGNTDIIHKSDIETIVTANAAASIYGNSTATNEIAAAVSNSAEARAEFFEEFSEGDAGSNISAYFEAMTDAQFEYESALHSSSSNDQAEAAFDSYLETKVNAYADAGLDAKENAEFLHMNGQVILNSMSSVSSEVENDVRSSSSYMIAIATDNAVRARAEASGMSETTISAIADAGATLRADVQGSNGSNSSIEVVFETYHDEVRTAIENDSSVEGAVIVTIDAEINAAGGIKAAFNNSLSGLISASQLTNAYVDFDNNVEAIVESNSALVGDIDTEILADIMVLINLSS